MEGVLIFQMPVGKINAIMQEKSGLGETGETFLVGHDLRMRSQSRLTEDATLLALTIDSEAANSASNCKTDSMIDVNHKGASVLSSFTPLNITDLDWSIVAEIHAAEAFEFITVITDRVIILRRSIKRKMIKQYPQASCCPINPSRLLPNICISLVTPIPWVVKKS